MAEDAVERHEEDDSAPGVPRKIIVYDESFARQAGKLCRLGATDADLADFFGVSRVTVRRWSLVHEAFGREMKDGKKAADDRVERSLYHRAMGYTFEAVKIFHPAGAAGPVYAPYQEHVPPDPQSMMFWLKNRRPDLWKDKREIEASGAMDVTVTRKIV
jgi:hypothetical protein